MKALQVCRLLIMSGLFFSLMGCAHQKMLFDKPGLTSEEFNRDKYDCVQQSRTSWAGGGTGSVGAAMIVMSKSNADKQAQELFKMCMEARGYTSREVDDDEFERQKSSPLKIKTKQISQELNEKCAKAEFKPLFIKSACKARNISLEQLADITMISEVEKPVFSKYRSEGTDLNNQLLDAMRTDGQSKEKEFASVLEGVYAQLDKIALDLFEGRITWGQYNKKRKELYQGVKEEQSRIFSK